ncbi:MAG: hypothetical protein OQK77_00440 [Psychromonas sp.]|nr:hypothetical protein [Psychromonas sp.]
MTYRDRLLKQNKQKLDNADKRGVLARSEGHTVPGKDPLFMCSIKDIRSNVLIQELCKAWILGNKKGGANDKQTT